jgi:hypothetical protein
MAIFGLSRVRTELFQLLVVPFLAHHPEQTNGQSPIQSILYKAMFNSFPQIVLWRFASARIARELMSKQGSAATAGLSMGSALAGGTINCGGNRITSCGTVFEITP